jgi:multidrug efflux pump subunit AcrB
MHNIWIFFLKNRAFTYMVIGALVVTGLYSLIAIPKESSPEVVIPMGIVSTTLRGASAEDVEKLITEPLEEEIANIEDIDTVTSSSREGVSVITAQFIASADVDSSIQELKDAVDRAKVALPNEAGEPNVLRVNFADQPVLIAAVSVDRPAGELPQLAEALEHEIKNIRGVSKVSVSGIREQEIQVTVKKEALLKYGLRLDQIIGAIQSADSSFPIGTITVADVHYPITFEGSVDTVDVLADIPLMTQNGALLALRDVAIITDGLAASEQSITISVFKKEGGDVTRLTKEVRERITELQSDSLAGATVVVSFDRGELVAKDLKELTRVGIETVILVMLVLFLTIGWRESVVAALSIPLSFVIAFIGLYASGNTINFISLFSLILAIGILVDSGIVVTEAIHARLKKYGSAEESAEASIREYAWPLIAGTMTTVAVFAPLFFISGIVGKFIASIPFTIIFVLIASILVALGMVPLLAILFTKEHKSALEDKQEEYAERAREWYKRILGRLLDDRRVQNTFLVSMIIGLVVAIMLPVTGLVKVKFFPEGDQDLVYVEIERAQGTPIEVTDRTARAVEEILYAHEDIASFVTTVGEGSSFSQSGPGSGSKLANITVILAKERQRSSLEIMQELREALRPINEAKITVEQMASGPPSAAPIVITFSGDDFTALGIATDNAEKLLRDISGTRDVTTSLRDDGTQFTVAIDRSKAAEVGLSAVAVAQTLRTAVAGSIVTTIKRDGEDADVVVKLDLNPDFTAPEETTRTTMDSVNQIPVATPNGSVLLGSLLVTRPTESKAAIAHEDRSRVASVIAQLSGDRTALEIVSDFKSRESELELDPSVGVSYGGESEDVNNSFKEMGLALVAGMVLMLAILVLEFNSFRYTLYLLSIIPLSLIGVMAGLGLTGEALSFPSMLGIIALAGVIINHAIILLDSMLHRLRSDDGHSPLRTIIIESAAVRLRPIFLTTVTTVIGMIPLAGASPLWGPLAFSIMFGLTFAIILTLLLVPVLFYRWPGKDFAVTQGTSKH